MSELENAIQSDAQVDDIVSLLNRVNNEIADFKAWYSEWGYAI